MNGSIGPSRTFKEGLPQGSVLFPHLPTIYINDLIAEFKNTFVSVNADDLLIAHNARNKNIIVASLQPQEDKVVAWSDTARLNHNTSKCETAFFGLDWAEAAWQPNNTIDGNLMFCNHFPVFLGVRYDRQHTYAEHVRKLCQSQTEPSPASSTLPQWKQSSRNPSCPLFQRVSKPSPTKS